MNRIYFISDLHLSHNNIIKYCNRPYENVEAMNNDIIKRWNSVVSKNDTVWVLGDIGLGKKENIKKLLLQLNGHKKLIMGNHDSASIKFYYECGFHRVYDKPVIINDFFILSHKPLEWVANPMFNIYGHVHDNKCYKTWSKTGCCVCVERHNYTPISWRTIESKIEELTKNDN